ncbi:hypothetical protein FOA52_000191 [Chlamydomonas sp. UWO 241]|nr:hypothetical protein FOA52_000191 [Chlamydomonas sp. UWO 241]
MPTRLHDNDLGGDRRPVQAGGLKQPAGSHGAAWESDVRTRRRTADQTSRAKPARLSINDQHPLVCALEVPMPDGGTARLQPLVHRVCMVSGIGGQDAIVGEKQAVPRGTWRTRWQKNAPAESSCILELRRCNAGDLVLQVVFSSKAVLPETMQLLAGPKVVGPFSPVCGGLVLPLRTKHCLNLGGWGDTMRENKYLKLLFSGTQAKGQGMHSVDALSVAVMAPYAPPSDPEPHYDPEEEPLLPRAAPDLHPASDPLLAFDPSTEPSLSPLLLRSGDAAVPPAGSAGDSARGSGSAAAAAAVAEAQAAEAQVPSAGGASSSGWGEAATGGDGVQSPAARDGAALPLLRSAGSLQTQLFGASDGFAFGGTGRGTATSGGRVSVRGQTPVGGGVVLSFSSPPSAGRSVNTSHTGVRFGSPCPAHSASAPSASATPEMGSEGGGARSMVTPVSGGGPNDDTASSMAPATERATAAYSTPLSSSTVYGTAREASSTPQSGSYSVALEHARAAALHIRGLPLGASHELLLPSGRRGGSSGGGVGAVDASGTLQRSGSAKRSMQPVQASWSGLHRAKSARSSGALGSDSAGGLAAQQSPSPLLPRIQQQADGGDAAAVDDGLNGDTTTDDAQLRATPPRGSRVGAGPSPSLLNSSLKALAARSVAPAGAMPAGVAGMRGSVGVRATPVRPLSFGRRSGGGPLPLGGGSGVGGGSYALAASLRASGSAWTTAAAASASATKQPAVDATSDDAAVATTPVSRAAAPGADDSDTIAAAAAVAPVCSAAALGAEDSDMFAAAAGTPVSRAAASGGAEDSDTVAAAAAVAPASTAAGAGAEDSGTAAMPGGSALSSAREHLLAPPDALSELMGLTPEQHQGARLHDSDVLMALGTPAAGVARAGGSSLSSAREHMLAPPDALSELMMGCTTPMSHAASVDTTAGQAVEVGVAAPDVWLEGVELLQDQHDQEVGGYEDSVGSVGPATPSLAPAAGATGADAAATPVVVAAAAEITLPEAATSAAGIVPTAVAAAEIFPRAVASAVTAASAVAVTTQQEADGATCSVPSSPSPRSPSARQLHDCDQPAGMGAASLPLQRSASWHGASTPRGKSDGHVDAASALQHGDGDAAAAAPGAAQGAAAPGTLAMWLYRLRRQLHLSSTPSPQRNGATAAAAPAASMVGAAPPAGNAEQQGGGAEGHHVEAAAVEHKEVVGASAAIAAAVALLPQFNMPLHAAAAEAAAHHRASAAADITPGGGVDAPAGVDAAGVETAAVPVALLTPVSVLGLGGSGGIPGGLATAGSTRRSIASSGGGVSGSGGGGSVRGSIGSSGGYARLHQHHARYASPAATSAVRRSHASDARGSMASVRSSAASVHSSEASARSSVASHGGCGHASHTPHHSPATVAWQQQGPPYGPRSPLHLPRDHPAFVPPAATVNEPQRLLASQPQPQPQGPRSMQQLHDVPSLCDGLASLGAHGTAAAASERTSTQQQGMQSMSFIAEPECEEEAPVVADWLAHETSPAARLQPTELLPQAAVPLPPFGADTPTVPLSSDERGGDAEAELGGGAEGEMEAAAASAAAAVDDAIRNITSFRAAHDNDHTAAAADGTTALPAAAPGRVHGAQSPTCWSEPQSPPHALLFSPSDPPADMPAVPTAPAAHRHVHAAGAAATAIAQTPSVATPLIVAEVDAALDSCVRDAVAATEVVGGAADSGGMLGYFWPLEELSGEEDAESAAAVVGVGVTVAGATLPHSPPPPGARLMMMASAKLQQHRHQSTSRDAIPGPDAADDDTLWRRSERSGHSDDQEFHSSPSLALAAVAHSQVSGPSFANLTNVSTPGGVWRTNAAASSVGGDSLATLISKLAALSSLGDTPARVDESTAATPGVGDSSRSAALVMQPHAHGARSCGSPTLFPRRLGGGDGDDDGGVRASWSTLTSSLGGSADGVGGTTAALPLRGSQWYGHAHGAVADSTELGALRTPPRGTLPHHSSGHHGAHGAAGAASPSVPAGGGGYGHGGTRRAIDVHGAVSPATPREAWSVKSQRGDVRSPRSPPPESVGLPSYPLHSHAADHHHHRHSRDSAATATATTSSSNPPAFAANAAARATAPTAVRRVTAPDGVPATTATAATAITIARPAPAVHHHNHRPTLGMVCARDPAIEGALLRQQLQLGLGDSFVIDERLLASLALVAPLQAINARPGAPPLGPLTRAMLLRAARRARRATTDAPPAPPSDRPAAFVGPLAHALCQRGGIGAPQQQLQQPQQLQLTAAPQPHTHAAVAAAAMGVGRALDHSSWAETPDLHQVLQQQNRQHAAQPSAPSPSPAKDWGGPAAGTAADAALPQCMPMHTALSRLAAGPGGTPPRGTPPRRHTAAGAPASSPPPPPPAAPLHSAGGAGVFAVVAAPARAGLPTRHARRHTCTAATLLEVATQLEVARGSAEWAMLHADHADAARVEHHTPLPQGGAARSLTIHTIPTSPTCPNPGPSHNAKPSPTPSQALAAVWTEMGMAAPSPLPHTPSDARRPTATAQQVSDGTQIGPGTQARWAHAELAHMQVMLQQSLDASGGSGPRGGHEE